MMTIGTMPRVLSSFFRPRRRFFAKPAWLHFWGLVMAMAVGVEHTVGRLNALLRAHTHRTNNGEFLWRSHWDESEVLRAIALQQFGRLYRKGETIYFILDDTQTLKRAKKMAAVGKLYHHTEKRYATGHTILKVCLYFATLTELAGRAIGSLPFPPDFPVTVLFDSYLPVRQCGAGRGKQGLGLHRRGCAVLRTYQFPCRGRVWTDAFALVVFLATALPVAGPFSTPNSRAMASTPGEERSVPDRGRWSRHKKPGEPPLRIRVEVQDGAFVVYDAGDKPKTNTTAELESLSVPRI